LWDRDLRFVRVSPGLAALDGVSVEDHMGRPIRDVVPDLPDSVIEASRNVLQTGEPVTGLRVSFEQDGVSRTFSRDCYPVVAGGDVVGMWATVTELTGELTARATADRAAGELARERGILREVIAGAPAPMAVMWGEELVFSYVNEQALDLMPSGELVGMRADEVFPAGEGMAADLRAAVLGRGETVSVNEVPLGDRFWTFSCVPLPGDRDRPGGVLAVGQEITAQVERRRELEAELAQEHRIATQLQVSLMPEQLPEVPGMDIASGFRPAGQGHEIGGDFYDVFECSKTSWMVVIGDVCGKGAEAAALTALARYTLRAAAIQEGAEPAKLLAQLNEAILRQRNDMRFVSAVCAFVHLEEAGARVDVCVAGHLPPLRVDDGGTVTPIAGGGGPVLGIWDDPKLAEEEVRLEVGQRLVLYTDGVLDAQRSTPLTERGLAHLLGGFSAGSAADTVAQIERSVLGDTVGRDDIAVLVLRPFGGAP
jgi:serine phosphatase RsbU (regulator of sigma subunit)/PAS domain-containing protein